MKAQPIIAISATKKKQWKSPLNINLYNRSPCLTKSESEEIKLVLERNKKWLAQSHRELERLLCPLNDALNVTQAVRTTRSSSIRVILNEMNERQTSFWSWSQEDWNHILCLKNFNVVYQKVAGDSRSHIIAVAYLLNTISIESILSHKFSKRSLAVKVFGKELVNQAVNPISKTYISLGNGKGLTKQRLPDAVCHALLANYSPYLEDLTVELLDDLRHLNIPIHVKNAFVGMSRALACLGIINQPLKPSSEKDRYFGCAEALNDVQEEWQHWCYRWYETSTLAPNTRRRSLYQLLKVGRWLTQEHPTITSPEQWSRNLAIKFVAAVDKMKVGDYIKGKKSLSTKIGQPLSPRDKDQLIGTLRRFFKDCQEWEWISRGFSPDRTLKTPRSIRALISPNPRVIANDIWAKLLWAGLNLSENDLPGFQYYQKKKRNFWYPLEMVQAITIVWLFAGLRSDEIYRLRVGCVRWQKDNLIIPGTKEILSKDAVCLLDVPVNKTTTAYTKPVDRIVGEAIEAWEKVRPDQPVAVDRKDGSLVYYLFSYRGRRVGTTYINHSIIPMLCQKAGLPTSDAKGKITSHRGRSTIATQLANAKEPMTLLELKQWLGHSNVGSTINYVKVSPTKLAKSYQDAEYFKRNIRTVEVLIDQDAVKSGAAAKGQPWKYYDLGHGYCTYDFFDQCKHRMACAQCNFYVPKDSSKGQILESQENLAQMLQEIPLTEEEQAAVEEGIEAMQKLAASLANVPTPSGQTPRQLDMHKNQ